MDKNLDALFTAFAASLQKAVTEVVRKAFPKLVAIEMLKLEAGDTKRPAVASKRPAVTSKRPAVASKRKPVISAREALVKHGSKTAAAKAMGLARSTFQDRLKQEAKALTNAVASGAL